MYIPAAFRVTDFERLSAVIEEHSFATVVTQSDDLPVANHLPLLFESERGPLGTLTGHIARANTQKEDFASGKEVLAIFHGPHAYISPSWYEAKVAVPTWNYIAVHAYGVARIIEDTQRLDALLENLTRKYEAGFARPWRDDLPTDMKAKMRQAIIGFEIPINRIEGKFKLGQNRSENDLRGVYDALSQSPRAEDQALAQAMLTESIL